MKQLKINTWPDPILNTVSTPVSFFIPPMGYQSWEEFERDFIFTMLTANGIGLAANQVGVAQRFFALGWKGFDVFRKPAIIYNARITKASDELEIGEEGCLSFPGLLYNVYRSKEIEIEYQDMKGTTFNKSLKDLEARCFQHELDHINGITFNTEAEELQC